mmetsp:Transcript_9555/g.31582  ORF Transcript_9555/g.31582 Transcript_9555/m.31582 type:complete len:469 (-) Transcript_9555:2-1408(-)
MAVKVQVHALAEPGRAEERAVHADDLCALVVDGDGVEVVHCDVRLWPDGVRHRARVLRKLRRPHDAHVVDALRRLRSRLLRKVLVAEDGEALLQGELEPVSAGDAVAGPVVEVLVRDDAEDAVVVAVRGSRGLGEDAGRVEDVEALILHGSHVEVVHRDNVVHVQVVLAAVAVLVPLHRTLQRLQRPVQLVQVLELGPHRKAHAPARRRHESALHAAEVARHEREEITRLEERILERGPVALALFALGHLVAVGEEDGVLFLVGLDAHRVLCHDVGAVVEERDAAEALGLALRHAVARRRVESRELRVLLRLDGHRRRESKGARRRRLEREHVRLVFERARVQRGAVDGDGDEAELLAVEDEGLALGADARRDLERARHEGLFVMDVKIQVDGFDRIRSRRIIAAELLHRCFHVERSSRHGAPCQPIHERAQRGEARRPLLQAASDGQHESSEDEASSHQQNNNKLEF